MMNGFFSVYPNYSHLSQPKECVLWLMLSWGQPTISILSLNVSSVAPLVIMSFHNLWVTCCYSFIAKFEPLSMWVPSTYSSLRLTIMSMSRLYPFDLQCPSLGFCSFSSFLGVMTLTIFDRIFKIMTWDWRQ